MYFQLNFLAKPVFIFVRSRSFFSKEMNFNPCHTNVFIIHSDTDLFLISSSHHQLAHDRVKVRESTKNQKRTQYMLYKSLFANTDLASVSSRKYYIGPFTNKSGIYLCLYLKIFKVVFIPRKGVEIVYPRAITR